MCKKLLFYALLTAKGLSIGSTSLFEIYTKKNIHVLNSRGNLQENRKSHSGKNTTRTILHFKPLQVGLECLSHCFMAGFYYSIPSDSRCSITNPSKHSVCLQSAVHMSDTREVAFAILMLYKNRFYLKVLLLGGYKDLILSQFLQNKGCTPETPCMLPSHMFGSRHTSSCSLLSV